MNCVFCEIARGVRKAHVVYESEHVIAFLDIMPAGRGHTLVAPKEHYENIFDVPEELLREMISVAKKVALALRSAMRAEGVNIIMNSGRVAGQVIMHAHIHVIPRRRGDGIRFILHQRPAGEDELSRVAEELRRELSVTL